MRFETPKFQNTNFMYAFKKILVAVDLTALDETITQFASFISNNSEAEEIYFVNVIKDFSIPKKVEQEFPGLLKNAMADRILKIKESVKNHFKNSDIQINYIVERGQRASKVLDMIDKYKIDLVIAGEKIHLKGTGVFTYRLARRAKCSLMIIPENTTPKVEKLLVPIDFSTYSRNALEKAISLARKLDSDVKIVCQNVFRVPVGYHYTNKSYKQFAERMKKHAKEDYDKFIKKIDTDGVNITECYTLDEESSPVNAIYEKAQELEVDMILFGAKGRSSTTALFMGSLAERLIQIDNKIPMLIVRPKGKAAGWIEMLREI